MTPEAEREIARVFAEIARERDPSPWSRWEPVAPAATPDDLAPLLDSDRTAA